MKDNNTMKRSEEEKSEIDFSKLDVQKLYDALARIIGKRENLKITFTVEKKEKK